MRAIISSSLLLVLLAVPAYGLWGLSNDEGGVFGMAHTRFGEGYGMVHFGLLLPTSRGAGLTAW